MWFTTIRVNDEARTLTLKGLSPEAMIASVSTEMKSKPVSLKNMPELPFRRGKNTSEYCVVLL